jgi:hypothetical protein
MDTYSVTTCPQCRELGIDVEYSKTFVQLLAGGGYCKLCQYTTKPDGMPVLSTVRKVVKVGSKRT